MLFVYLHLYQYYFVTVNMLQMLCIFVNRDPWQSYRISSDIFDLHFLPLCVCDNDKQHDNIACVSDVEKLDEPYASV